MVEPSIDQDSTRTRSVRRWHMAGRFVLLLLVVYVIAKSYSKGNDINVYLHAGNQIISDIDPFNENPYNNYLYSPLFALLMAPLSMLGLPIARVIWALLNCFLIYRTWNIFKVHSDYPSRMSERMKVTLVACSALLAFNSFNHNLILGQMTVLMLWMVIESLHRIRNGQWMLGALILGLGINIKIIPLFALGYLLLDKRFKALGTTLLVLILLMILPAIFLGWEQNMALHEHWLEVINPFKSKFGLEKNDGCVSLNCLWSRLSGDESLLNGLTNFSRLIVILLFSYYMLIRNRYNDSLRFWREASLVLMAIILFFPHQMKYTMLFILPATIYFLYGFLQSEKDERNRPIYYLLGFCFILPAIIGRDIIGNAATDFFDTIGMMGILNLLIFLVLVFWRPRNVSA